MNRLVTIEMYAQVRFKKLKITIFVGIIPIFFSIFTLCIRPVWGAEFIPQNNEVRKTCELEETRIAQIEKPKLVKPKPIPAINSCLHGWIVKKWRGQAGLIQYPNAPIKIYRSGTTNILKQTTSNDIGYYCLNGLWGAVDIVVYDYSHGPAWVCEGRLNGVVIPRPSATKSCQSGGCFLADRLICDCHAD
jgi:hypothetical protein